MTDDELVMRLEAIEEELADRAMERLAAAIDGDASARDDEKRLLRARRAVARAISALRDR